MSNSFAAELAALTRGAQVLDEQARRLAVLIERVAAVGTVDAGDGHVNGLIAQRVDEVTGALAGAGRGMQSDAGRLIQVAQAYAGVEGTNAASLQAIGRRIAQWASSVIPTASSVWPTRHEGWART